MLQTLVIGLAFLIVFAPSPEASTNNAPIGCFDESILGFSRLGKTSEVIVLRGGKILFLRIGDIFHNFPIEDIDDMVGTVTVLETNSNRKLVFRFQNDRAEQRD